MEYVTGKLSNLGLTYIYIIYDTLCNVILID